MSVVEVDDPQLVILLHFMTPFMSIQPVFESPLARPASIQGSMASQLLIDLLRDRPGSHGMLLVSIEQDGMMINSNDYILSPIHFLIYERQPCLEPVNRATPPPPPSSAILVMVILTEDFVVCQNKTLPFVYMNVFRKDGIVSNLDIIPKECYAFTKEITKKKKKSISKSTLD